jgi:hypothetical protein
VRAISAELQALAGKLNPNLQPVAADPIPQLRKSAA